MIGNEKTFLVEGKSRKSDNFFAGRTDSNKVVIFPVDDKINDGDYVKVKINKATQATLFGNYSSHTDIKSENLALIA